MGIPSSKIKKGYTSGNEYVYPKSTKYYKGYYYTINGKSYAGKDFDLTKPPQEVVLAKKIKAINDPNSLLYNVLAGIRQGAATTPAAKSPTRNRAAVLTSIQEANQQGFTAVVGINPDADINALNSSSEQQVTESTITKKKRYFFRRIVRTTKEGPEYQFGEINSEDEFNRLSKTTPIYTTASITQTQIPGQDPVFDDAELNAAEKRMPGLKSFLKVDV
jgi:cellulase/cellobiase CelA1